MLQGLFIFLPVHAVSYDWSKPRPSNCRAFSDGLGSATTDGECAVGLGVEIYDYHENTSLTDNDYLRFRVSISANTRVGVDYAFQFPAHGFQWLEVSNPTGITGDNVGVWLDLGFAFLFYGVEYRRIWVCSNGFVSLTSESAEANPNPIPSNSTPNAVIAPFWRNLKPNLGGSITYGKEIFNGDNGNYYFVVSWNNVPDANGNPQTFQLLIEQRQGYGSDVFHNRVFFQYKSITKDLPTSIGVEKQLGFQGYSVDLNDSWVKNDGCFGIFPSYEGSRLLTLKIRLTKSDSQALLDPILNYISGYNVELNDTSNPYGDVWAPVIGFAADLLIDKAMQAGLLTTGAGIAIGSLFVLLDIGANIASEQYSEGVQHYSHAGPNDGEAFVFATCKAEELGGGAEIQGEPFDASLASTFEWSFTDPNNAPHTLTVTAEASYYNFATGQGNTVTTSVTLNMYTGYHYLDLQTCLYGGAETTGVKVWIDGNEYSSPILSLILADGTHTIQVETPIYRNSIKYTFEVWSDSIFTNPRTIELNGDWNCTALYKAYYNLSISAVSLPEGGGTTSPAPGTYEYVERSNIAVTATASAGFVFTHWTLDGTSYFVNPMNVTMNSNHALTAYFASNSGGGDSCPVLLVWNITTYISLCVLPIHDSSGEDVTLEVSIQKELVDTANYTARFMLLEGWSGLNFSESFIDNIKLYAADVYGNRYLCPLTNAIHSREGNVWLKLLFSDNWKTQILLLETTELTFFAPWPPNKIQGYIFIIEGCNMLKQ